MEPAPPHKFSSSTLLHAHQRRLDTGAGESLLGRVGIGLALERADAHAVHHAAGLLALGDLGRQPEQRQASHILIKVDQTATDAQKNDARAKIDDVLKQVKAGMGS